MPKPVKSPYVVKGTWDKEKVLEFVFDQLATSSKSLGSILKAGANGHPLPNYSTIIRWIDADDEVCKNYARAREAQADYMADEFAEIHEKAWVPVLVDGVPLMVGDKPLMTVDKSSAAAARLEADNKKWLMSKLKPKKYGERQAVDVSGHLTTGDMSIEDMRAELAALAPVLLPAKDDASDIF